MVEIPPMYGCYIFYVSGIATSSEILPLPGIWALYLICQRNFCHSEIAGSAESLRLQKFCCTFNVYGYSGGNSATILPLCNCSMYLLTAAEFLTPNSCKGGKIC